MKSISCIFVSVAFLLFTSLLSSCLQINESVLVAESAIQSATEAIRSEREDEPSGETITSIDNFAYVLDENQLTITLLWQSTDTHVYTVVRSSNPDCDAIDETTCNDFIQFNAVASPFTDSDIQAGSTYFYRIMARASPVASKQSTMDSATVDTDVIVGDQLQVALDFDDSVHGVELLETTDLTFLDDVYVTRASSKIANVAWRSNPDIDVTVYSSTDADCDVLDPFDHCANAFTYDGSEAKADIDISVQTDLDSHYFWVYAKKKAFFVQSDTDEYFKARLYGPMKAMYLAGIDKSTQLPGLKIIEKATFDDHKLSVIFPVHDSLIHRRTIYNFYIISGSHAAEKTLVSRLLSPETHYGIPSVEEFRLAVTRSGSGDLYLNYKTLKYDDMELLPSGEMLFDLGDVKANTWYTVVLIAAESEQLYNYQTAARKTLQHMRINVRGNKGMWRIRDKVTGAIYKAKVGSGLYYPGPVDWRNLMVDALLSFPDKQAYYFTGCAYYHDDPVLGDKQQLFNNECHYAQADTEPGIISTVLSHPTPITVIFERKANAIGCQNYQELPANDYRRSRKYQLGTYGDPICDHRIPTTDNNGRPNYFSMVYPHGEPTEIANGHVPQWYGGTQVPMYIGGVAPLPVMPDGMVTTTICSDLGEDNKCAFSADINLIRCNGYYAYQLVQPSGCSVGYAWEETQISAMHRLLIEDSQ